MSEREQFSIIVLGQNTLAREGLRRILEEGDFIIDRSVVGLCELTSTDDITPALIVLDENCPDHVEAELTGVLAAFPKSRVVVLVDDFSFDAMVKAFNAGAHGYLVKRLGCNSLIASLRLAAMGEMVMPSQLAGQLTEGLLSNQLTLSQDTNLTELLSDRELETMRYLLGGNPNKVIACHLDVSEATIKVHVKSILRKLGVRNRTQAAIWAVNNGMDFGRPAPTVSAANQPRMTA
jgi:two-component system nitrate/nitrite response regulator NarL